MSQRKFMRYWVSKNQNSTTRTVFHSELNVGMARIKALKKQTGIITVFETTNNIYISAIV